MPQVRVTLPDGSERQVPAGTSVREFAAAALPAGVVRKALAAMADGRLVDLSHPLDHDTTLRLVTPESPEALPLYRHSTAHLLAAAVTNLFPGVQCGIGPATDEGFFYDFVVPRPFVPEDLEAIEARMRELAAADLPYERQMWPREEALDFFTRRGEPLKVQLIEEKTDGQREVSCYTIKDRDTFVDFCVGPHVPSTSRLKAFKLLGTSNAYWKGDARNQPMQRIYGTAFFKEDELKQHLRQIEEAKKRDHRRLGKDLGLFLFHPWAPGSRLLARQGHDALPPARRLHARGALPGRLHGSEDADHLQQGALGDVRPLAALSPEHVPRRDRERRNGRQGHELPGAHAALRQRGAQLPRPAPCGSTSRRRCTATRRPACCRG